MPVFKSDDPTASAPFYAEVLGLEVVMDLGWIVTYAAFVAPLVALAIGLGVANGPASSGSTSSVSADEVGQASGISNMARYIGAAVAVAIIATIFNAVTNNHQESGDSAADSLAAGLAAASLTMAIWAAAGVLLVRVLAGHRLIGTRAVDRAAAAAASVHTIPIVPTSQDNGAGPKEHRETAPSEELLPGTGPDRK